MNLPTAINILASFNKWRRGKTDEIDCSPEQLGIAIDTVIAAYSTVFINEGETAYDHLQRIAGSQKLGAVLKSAGVGSSAIYKWKQHPNTSAEKYAKIVKAIHH